jgi:hypothetical protein
MPVSPISNGTMSSMICHLKSGTCAPYQCTSIVWLSSLYITTTRSELLRDKVWEAALNIGERLLRDVEVDMRLYCAPKCPCWGHGALMSN